MTHHVVQVLRVVVAAAVVVGSAPSLSRAAAQDTGAGTTGGPAPGHADTSRGSQTSSSVPKPQCEAHVAALVGKDSAALRDHDVQVLAKRWPMLTACGAVVRDSDEPCALLTDDEAKSCRKTRMNYHELRDPKKHGFVLSDDEYRGCKESVEVSVCDALRAAINGGDATKCPSKQPIGAVCRATITLDPTLCPEGDADCKKDIEHWKTFANGLKGLRKSGTPDEQALAAAALGEADACKQIAEPALRECGATAKEMGAPSPAPSGEPEADDARSEATPKP